ncbi:uncharacterized protein [Haliotis asinina]|uniref:uncharacterized protein n=1 Tax=Haliotis asinina TaxID=109174 RepID=UPI003531AF1B
MFAVTLIILFASEAGAVEYANGAVSPWRGEIVPMGIELHNKTMLTYPGTPDPPMACFEKTINFHDFTRGLVAMKAVGKDVCYIKTSGETYEEMKKVVDGINHGDRAPKMQATEEWSVSKTPVPTEEVSKRMGKGIAKFCRGSKVYVFEDGKVIREASDADAARSLPRLMKRGGCILCWSCNNKKRSL